MLSVQTFRFAYFVKPRALDNSFRLASKFKRAFRKPALFLAVSVKTFFIADAVHAVKRCKQSFQRRRINHRRPRALITRMYCKIAYYGDFRCLFQWKHVVVFQQYNAFFRTLLRQFMMRGFVERLALLARSRLFD